MARSYFCDHCKHAMARDRSVTLNIAVNESHKARFFLQPLAADDVGGRYAGAAL
jgi:hypothetical protein